MDLIYAPAVTPLLAAARARGASTCNGLGMLIHQAVRQFEIWTGSSPSADVMSAAALLELARRAETGDRRDEPGVGATTTTAGAAAAG